MLLDRLEQVELRRPPRDLLLGLPQHLGDYGLRCRRQHAGSAHPGGQTPELGHCRLHEALALEHDLVPRQERLSLSCQAQLVELGLAAVATVARCLVAAIELSPLVIEVGLDNPAGVIYRAPTAGAPNRRHENAFGLESGERAV